MWALRTQRESEAAVAPIQRAMRLSMRPILGVSSEGFTNAEIAAALDLPLPVEHLHLAKVRSLQEVLRSGLRDTWAKPEADGAWLRLAWRSIQHVFGEDIPLSLCCDAPTHAAGMLDLLHPHQQRLRRLSRALVLVQTCRLATHPGLRAQPSWAPVILLWLSAVTSVMPRF